MPVSLVKRWPISASFLSELGAKLFQHRYEISRCWPRAGGTLVARMPAIPAVVVRNWRRLTGRMCSSFSSLRDGERPKYMTAEATPNVGTVCMPAGSVSERNDLARGVEAERAGLPQNLEVGALPDVGEVGLGALDLSDHERVLDPDDPRLLGLRQPDAAERAVDGLEVRVERERHLGAVGGAGRQAVDGGLLPVDLLRQT